RPLVLVGCERRCFAPAPERARAHEPRQDERRVPVLADRLGNRSDRRRLRRSGLPRVALLLPRRRAALAVLRKRPLGFLDPTRDRFEVPVRVLDRLVHAVESRPTTREALPQALEVLTR